MNDVIWEDAKRLKIWCNFYKITPNKKIISKNSINFKISQELQWIVNYILNEGNGVICLQNYSLPSANDTNSQFAISINVTDIFYEFSWFLLMECVFLQFWFRFYAAEHEGSKTMDGWLLCYDGGRAVGMPIDFWGAWSEDATIFSFFESKILYNILICVSLVSFMFFCFVFIGSLSLRFYFEIGILQSHHCRRHHWRICGTIVPPIPYQSHLRLRSSLTLQLVWHSCCYCFFVYWLAVKQSALAYCSSTGRVTTLTKTTLTKAMVWLMFVVGGRRRRRHCHL